MEQLHKPGEARFTDPLEPELEATWTELTDALNARADDATPVLVPLWADQTAPQAIRDRAMLALIGTGKYTPSVPNNLFGYMGITKPAPHIQFESTIPEFSIDQFAQWLMDASAYKTESDELIPTYRRLDWSVDLLDRGALSHEQFDGLLETINLQRLSDKTIYGAVDPDGDNWPSVPHSRLPLIYDAITGATGRSIGGEYYKWAVDRLRLLTAHQQGEAVELPNWLANTDYRWNCKELYEQVAQKFSTGNGINWQAIKPGVELFSWSILPMHRGINVGNLIDRIDNTEDKKHFVQYVLHANASARFIGEEYDQYNLYDRELLAKLRSYIPDSEVATLEAWDKESHVVESYLTKQEERSQAYKLQRRADERERRAREADRTELRKAASLKVAELLQTLREQSTQ